MESAVAAFFFDGEYQLEVNLQHIRLALIYFLEECEQYDEIFICHHRCSCMQLPSPSESITLSDLDYSNVDDSTSIDTELEFVVVETRPENVPLPESADRPLTSDSDSGEGAAEPEESVEDEVDFEEWVRASRPGAVVNETGVVVELDESLNNIDNLTWPPPPSSIWNYP